MISNTFHFNIGLHCNLKTFYKTFISIFQHFEVLSYIIYQMITLLYKLLKISLLLQIIIQMAKKEKYLEWSLFEGEKLKK